MSSLNLSTKEKAIPTLVETQLPAEIILNPIIEKLIKQISGVQIENQLLDLARIDGQQIPPQNPIQERHAPTQPKPTNNQYPPERYSISRLALSDGERPVRTYLKKIMLSLGMEVENHPLGLIATYTGKNPQLPAIGMISHFDSVPNAGMYDGTVGIIAALEIIRTLQKNNIQPQRPIKIIALTGEESARFNIALFGSKGMFHGLTEKELAMQDEQGISLKQAIINMGFDPEQVKKPLFKQADFMAVFELHVAQDARFPEFLSIIEAIAAPERYKAIIGNRKLEKHTPKPSDTIIELEILGTADHSGATPMGEEYRNDGFVLATNIAKQLLQIENLILGDFIIPDQAMNKIPGKIILPICITGKNREATIQKINRHAHKAVAKICLTPEKYAFYNSSDFRKRQKSLITTVQTVHEVANKYGSKQCVGTVSTYTNIDGQINLGIDLRGMNEEFRSKMISQIKRLVAFRNTQNKNPKVSFGRPLPGSGKPEAMNSELVNLAQQIFSQLEIAPTIVTYSPAGHDIQNVSRPHNLSKPKIPTLQIQIPSRNGGVSHNPEEYSNPQDLEWGTRALAAIVLLLADS